MAAATQSKRLSFGDGALRKSDRLQSMDTLAAFSDPTYETFYRALQHLGVAIEERFSQIEAAARSRVDQTGDSNPKAVQRHYDTLKNTYINLEMKEVFLDALLERRPSEQDTARLAEAEQELTAGANKLKEAKAHSKKLLTGVHQLIESLTASCDAFTASQGAAEEALPRLDELEQQSAALEPLPALPAGPDEAELKALVAAEMKQAQRLEASLARAQAELSELQAAVTSEENELTTLQSQILMQLLADQVKAGEAELQGRRAAASGNARFEEYIDWCQEMAELYSNLSGISILNVETGIVRMRINTIVSTGQALEPRDCSGGAEQLREVDHLLVAHMDNHSGNLLAAELLPPAMQLDSLVAKAHGSLCSLVRLIQASLAASLHREALHRGD